MDPTIDATGSAPLCFTCAQPIRADRWNELSDGEACPACRARLLDELPGPLPAAPRPAPADEALLPFPPGEQE